MVKRMGTIPKMSNLCYNIALNDVWRGKVESVLKSKGNIGAG